MPRSKARASAARDRPSSVAPYEVAPAVPPPMPQAPKPISDTMMPVAPSGRYFMKRLWDRSGRGASWMKPSIMSGQFPVDGPVAIEIGALLVAPPDDLPAPHGEVVTGLARPLDADRGPASERLARPPLLSGPPGGLRGEGQGRRT